MTLQSVDELVAEPVTRVIIRDPRRVRAGLRRARREGRAARHQLLHRLDRLARPRAAGRLQGLGAHVGVRPARRRRRRRARDRRRPQRHRDAAVGRPRGRDGPGPPRGAGGGRRRHRDASSDDGAARELGRWFAAADRRLGWSRPTSTARCCTPTAPSPTGPARCSTRSTRAACSSSSSPAGRSAGWSRCGTTSATTAWRSAATAAIVYDVPGRAVARGADDPPEVGLEVADADPRRRPGHDVRGGAGHRLRPGAGVPGHPEDRAGGEADAFRVQVAPLEEIFDDGVVKLLALHQEHAPLEYWAAGRGAGRGPRHDDLVVGRRAGRDERRRGHQGDHAGAGLRRARHRRRRGGRVR